MAGTRAIEPKSGARLVLRNAVELEAATLQVGFGRSGLDLGRPGGRDQQRLPGDDLHEPGIHADTRLQRFCEASGTWGHCMLLAGVRFDRPGACIIQSWGPDVPDGPTDLGQPDFSFWADKTSSSKF